MSDGDTWLVIIDMQNVFASGKWGCPKFATIIDPIRQLAASHPGRTLLTRFVDAPQKLGSWCPYYQEFKFANVADPNVIYDIVPALEDLITEDNVVTMTTFSKWDGILARTGPCPHLVLTGVATDCCFLSTAMQAAEAGAFVAVDLSACAASSDRNQVAAQNIMLGYHPLIQVTGITEWRDI